MEEKEKANLILEMKSRGWTNQTIKNYLYNIIKFKETTKSPKKYLFNLLKLNKSDSYYKSVYAAIKFYYDVNNKLFDFKKEDIKLPKKSKKLPKILNESNIKDMINKTTNLQHKLVITLLYSAGLRLNELRNLEWNNINFEKNIIFVKQGKGKKDRITLLSKKSKKDLKKLQYNSNSKYIFISQRKTRYNNTTIQRIVKQASIRANIEINVTPHTLRHSFATHLLENGTDIRYIQSLLGHAKLETTQIYTKVAKTKLENIKNPLD